MCVCVCVRACVRACVRVCVCVCAYRTAWRALEVSFVNLRSYAPALERAVLHLVVTAQVALSVALPPSA